MLASEKVRSVTLLLLAEVAAMSLWFVSAAVLPDMLREAELSAFRQAALSRGVQAGFVVGAMLSAVLGLADRFDPRRVCAASALAAALVNACEQGTELYVLPDVHSAYVEACRAASPKHEQQWSHPAVYLAGRASDWFVLANEGEGTAFPVFEHHYTRLCREVMQGKELTIEAPQPLPEKIERKLEGEDLQSRIQQLKKELNL